MFSARQVRTIPLVERPSVLNFASFGERPPPSIGAADAGAIPAFARTAAHAQLLVRS
jgi:hypothetical protein